ncbi:hypothetical protein BDP81DRAFT_414774 [Colletotrichum phormii]|uniref:Uncharacterized protein n=1 Tax=Colletotrichum phormii TaxID=359342 RepID=A0AAJ0A8C0_9PEZI|nr:uncharacterized protein BDP81DRAFT_414774 [Colletotrichum phormii]KAK1656395.1 hypothetical protein BDP81DRAFT_414774 [Colletotrichum phormii]
MDGMMGYLGPPRTPETPCHQLPMATMICLPTTICPQGPIGTRIIRSRGLHRDLR